MKKQYRVLMKDGNTHRCSEVEHHPGFVTLHSWDGEKKLPMGDVDNIQASKIKSGISSTSLFLAIMLATLVSLILLFPNTLF